MSIAILKAKAGAWDAIIFNLLTKLSKSKNDIEPKPISIPLQPTANFGDVALIMFRVPKFLHCTLAPPPEKELVNEVFKETGFEVCIATWLSATVFQPA